MKNKLPDVPFDSSYWVIPGLFLAGNYPAGFDELATRRRLQALIRCGMLTFIDLTHPGDHMPGYAEVLEDEANGYLVRTSCFQHPIEDFGTCSPTEMRQILDRIDASIAEQRPVYLHCIAGIGRTGTVVGCHLVRHGFRGEGALAEIQRLRSGMPNGWARSPEADEQVQFILDWDKNQL